MCIYQGKYDDCILIGKHSDIIKSFVQSLIDGDENFEFTDEGPMDKYLEVEIEKLKGNEFILRQPFLIQRILKALNVDAHGLDEMDNKILEVIIDKFKGGPVGISTIATAVSENTETIEEVYEPFLIQQGFIMRTPREREVTELAYQHLGRTKGRDQGELF